MSRIHVLDFLTSFEGRAFGRSVFLVGSVGNTNNFQLFNPAESGVRALIYQFRLASESLSLFMSISHHNTALGTLVGTGVNFSNPGTPAGKVELRTSQTAALLGTGIVQNMQAPANTDLVTPEWLMTLMPDKGVVVNSGSLNQTTDFTGIWVEVPL